MGYLGIESGTAVRRRRLLLLPKVGRPRLPLVLNLAVKFVSVSVRPSSVHGPRRPVYPSERDSRRLKLPLHCEDIPAISCPRR